MHHYLSYTCTHTSWYYWCTSNSDNSVLTSTLKKYYHLHVTYYNCQICYQWNMLLWIKIMMMNFYIFLMPMFIHHNRVFHAYFRQCLFYLKSNLERIAVAFVTVGHAVFAGEFPPCNFLNEALDTQHSRRKQMPRSRLLKQRACNSMMLLTTRAVRPVRRAFLGLHVALSIRSLSRCFCSHRDFEPSFPLHLLCEL